MHDIERYLMWGAIIVLFVLYFWPKPSMYTGEPNSITKLSEFASLNDDLKHLYNDQVLRGIKAWAPTMNKWWVDLSADKKSQINALVKQAADQVVANATNAKNLNGNDLAQSYLGAGQPPAAPTAPMPTPAAPTTTSRYMTEPFTPMVSKFGLQEALNKVTTATKVA